MSWHRINYVNMLKHKKPSQGAITMTDQIKEMLSNESLATLLRSNISCHMGKTMTRESLDEITSQIVDSINYFLNTSQDKSVD